MITLAQPMEDPRERYIACAQRTADQALRRKLLSEADRIAQRSEAYVANAGREELYLLTKEAAVNVTDEELRSIYGRVMVRGRERPAYDRLKGRALYQRCPLCAQRDVRTLDHYLPQCAFPEFSVLHANLVPACSECNKTKHDHVPTTTEEQLFHPYFDDWSAHRFVKASVTVGPHVAVMFCIDEGAGLPQRWLLRAQAHFRALDLGALYAQQAAVELVQRKEDFRTTFDAGGARALRVDLEKEAESRERPFPNAWQPVLYHALAETVDFYTGGFAHIEE